MGVVQPQRELTDTWPLIHLMKFGVCLVYLMVYVSVGSKGSYWSLIYAMTESEGVTKQQLEAKIISNMKPSSRR